MLVNIIFLSDLLAKINVRINKKIVDLINKMAKAKPRSGGGFFKGLIKNIAKVGLLAMALKAAPAAMGIAAVGGKMALGAGVLAAGGLLAGKAFGAVKRGLEKKKQGPVRKAKIET